MKTFKSIKSRTMNVGGNFQLPVLPQKLHEQLTSIKSWTMIDQKHFKIIRNVASYGQKCGKQLVKETIENDEKREHSSTAIDQSIKQKKEYHTSFAIFVRSIHSKNPNEEKTLREEVKRFFIDEYNKVIVKKLPSFGTEIMLEAFSLLLSHTRSLENEPIEIQRIVLQTLNEYVFPQLSLLLEAISSFTPNQILLVLAWLMKYGEYFSLPSEATIWLEKLMNEYLQRGVHLSVKLMVENRLLLINEDEIIENHDGTVSTSLPDDITFIIEIQLSVARDRLLPSMLPSILNACNEGLLDLVGGLMLQVEINWRHYNVERLCSIINDAQTLLDHCESRNVDIFEGNDDSFERVSENVLREFSELSLHAANYVCERIYLDIHDDVLALVGSSQWEQGDMIVGIAVATLEDYFQDIKTWVPYDYFFPKILKKCMDLLMQAYLNAFFTNTMELGLPNLDRALDILQSDWELLWNFFCMTNKKYHGRAGFYKKEYICDRLQIIQVVISLLKPDAEPNHIHYELLSIIKVFGVDTGAAAMLHLLGLKRRRISSSRAQEWHELVALAEEHAEMQCVGCEPWYQIPDIRHSRFIKRMKPKRKSSNDMVDTSKTKKLVRRALLNRIVTSSRKMLRKDRKLIATWKLNDNDEPWKNQTQE